ncbi:hypothetical protein BJ165DRAFT_1309147, partial [Panaeolus papilionaceus]
VSIWKFVSHSTHRTYCSFQNLSTKHRPSLVHTWMRGSVRNRSKVPTIHNVEKYGVDVLRWWKSLQPPRRVQDSQPPYSPETFSRNGGAWGDLVRGGSSGIYTVLMAVAWWV